MEILRKVMGPLETNSYLLAIGSEAVVIDPGFPRESVELAEYILEKGYKVKYIIATHGHFDHVLGVKSFRDRLGYKPQFLIHINDVELLAKAGRSLEKYFNIFIEPEKPDKLLFGGESFLVGRVKIEILHTPGHTRGSICIYLEEKGVLFTGDTLFRGTIGRLDLPESSIELFSRSIKKIFGLPPSTRIYPGHGDESTLENELEKNQYVKSFIG